MRIFKYILLFFSIMICISCTEEINFSEIPHIEFVSFTKIQNSSGIDDKGVLKITFTDGDGDLGLAKEDTAYPYNYENKYYYNFFIRYFEKQNGKYVEVELPLTFNARIPYITPESEEKALQGDIDIELFINNPFSSYDTIKYDIYIVDRALNESNIISTPDIIINN